MDALTTEGPKLLLAQGLLGLYALASTVAILFLTKWLLTSWRDRLADAKTIIEEQTRCITNSSQHIAMSSTAVATMNSTNERRTEALQAMGSDVRELKEVINELRRQR